MRDGPSGIRRSPGLCRSRRAQRRGKPAEGGWRGGGGPRARGGGGAGAGGARAAASAAGIAAWRHPRHSPSPRLPAPAHPGGHNGFESWPAASHAGEGEHCGSWHICFFFGLSSGPFITVTCMSKNAEQKMLLLFIVAPAIGSVVSAMLCHSSVITCN